MGSDLGPSRGKHVSFWGDRPDDLGLIEAHLRPCPESPNCVSSQSPDIAHQIAPLRFEGSPRMAMQALKHVIDDSERAEVIKADDHYLYAEFTSRLMGFVDDVEFYLDEAAKHIEVRSASRLGESDLGVNRKRIEQLRQAFEALLGNGASWSTAVGPGALAAAAAHGFQGV
ncbi:MAG: DUF1499 domain-containing protein [Synechococcales cyanobacterium RM1_1_8]|nr:DUF1499 domain-containing protein [Synechococcales cyanobacterium RM1_1_8]